MMSGMPWSLVLRILARIVLARAIDRRRARGAGPVFGTPGTVPGGRPGGVPRGGVHGDWPPRQRPLAGRVAPLRTAVEGARIAARAIALVVLLAAFSTLFAAGITLVGLGPRWAGIVLLALALITIVAATLELRGLLRLRDAWRLRRRDRRLGGGPGPWPR